MTARKKISFLLIASFGLSLVLSYWLQSQLVPVSISSYDHIKIEVPYSTSAILDLVRESLEDTESRRTGLSFDSQLSEQFSFNLFQPTKGVLSLEFFQIGLLQTELYLQHRKLIL